MQVRIQSDGLHTKVFDAETNKEIEGLLRVNLVLTPHGAYADLTFRVGNFPLDVVAGVVNAKEENTDAN